MKATRTYGIWQPTVAIFALVMGCASTQSVDDLAPPSEQSASIDGNVYALNPGAMTIDDADPGLPDLVRLFMSGNLYLRTLESGGQVDITFAFGNDDGTQDLCVRTSELGTAARTDDTLSLGPQDTTFYTAVQGFEVLNMTLDGDISSDGGTVDNVTLAGQVDLRQAVGIATFTDIDGVCSTFGDLGVTCKACDDGQIACADLTIRNLAANQVSADVQSWSASEVQSQNCPTE